METVLIDTNTLPREKVAGHPGAERQVLLAGDDEHGQVTLLYGPPGFTPLLRELLANGPHRHYHASVNERHYVLGGDYPVMHWSRPDAEPTLTRLVRHDYLENPPLTLHGISLDATPRAASKILQWTDGPGTMLFEPGAETETVEVPIGATPDAAFRDPVRARPDTLAWQAHRTHSGWRVGPLSGPAAHAPPVSLVDVPAGTDIRVESFSGGDRTLWLFVVAGDLELSPCSPASRGHRLTEGCFFAWSGALSSAIGAAPGDAALRVRSDGGCVVLCTGHQLGASADH